MAAHRSGLRKLLPAPVRAHLGQAAERILAIGVTAMGAGSDRRKVNIGGGPWFAHVGWHNLEEVPSLVNRRPWRLDPATVWPFGSATLDVAYASHVFEHLDSDTVAGILREAYRTLTRGGQLVICIPDFDRALGCWMNRAPSFFVDEYWDYSQVSHTWRSRHVPDTLDHRAAFLFCGFWNAHYGHPFRRQSFQSDRAYYGPPPLPAAVLKAVPDGRTPNEISALLRAWVTQHEGGVQFSHQNAWSRAELGLLLERAGFLVQSVDTAAVVERCNDFPRIRERVNRSTFCLATKP